MDVEMADDNQNNGSLKLVGGIGKKSKRKFEMGKGNCNVVGKSLGGFSSPNLFKGRTYDRFSWGYSWVWANTLNMALIPFELDLRCPAIKPDSI
ncbi:hypothetical protein L1049_017028 [Liquidambar formosana]|uniref:Uncharacterized protein n=1 Tax=Liquidambar formosana TaxID=63359 RepID=A0AAP0S2A3_LIQFO